MDFFDRQRQTKKNTARLVFYFILAVLFVSLLNHLAISLSILLFGLFFVGEESEHDVGDLIEFVLPFLMDLRFIGLSAFLTFCFICSVALIRMYQLKNGSTSLALAMGGRFVSPSSTEPKERQLLNVVEEMAIASSVIAPNVFVLEGERGINAMAVGSSVDDAVVLVTSGFLRQLNRQESQGVIAHEFSHILNEDMKINMRMVVMIHGMMVLRNFGNLLISGIGSRNSDGGGSHPALIAVGTAFIVTGSVGSGLAGLIKSAVSREREYLADASAVQFTRNPLGLAGALKKIGALKYGSRVKSYKVEEVSHMFFGSSIRAAKARLSRTHPPLLERIKPLDPAFDGDFSKVKLIEDNQIETPKPSDPSLIKAVAFAEIEAVEQHTEAGADLNQKGKDGSTPVVVVPLHGYRKSAQVMLANLEGATIESGSASLLADTIASPTIEHIDFAVVLLRSLPEVVRDAAHDTHDACALVFALLLDKRQEAVRQKQLGQVGDVFAEQMAVTTAKLYDEVIQLDPRAKLPVADLAVGSLRQLSPDQFASFKYVIDSMVSADQAIDLFEFSLSKLVMRHLEPHFNGGCKKVTQVYSLKRLGNECSVLISALANVAGADEAAIQVAFDAGVDQLASVPDMKQLPVDKCNFQQLDEALVKLNGVTLKLKRLLIQAAAASVSADGYLQVQEAEMLRVISDSLDCPMPPLAIALATAA